MLQFDRILAVVKYFMKKKDENNISLLTLIVSISQFIFYYFLTIFSNQIYDISTAKYLIFIRVINVIQLVPFKNLKSLRN